MRTWRNAPAVRANMYTRHEITLEEHRSWWDRTSTRADQKYLMHERGARPAGIVAFTAINPADRNACWAFYAAPDAAPGTGSRMEVLALEHAFGDLGLHKLYCEVLAFNEPVIRLHRKFGFSVEGVFRQQHSTDSGFVDVHRLGLLAHEWAAGREAAIARVTSLREGRS